MIEGCVAETTLTYGTDEVLNRDICTNSICTRRHDGCAESPIERHHLPQQGLGNHEDAASVGINEINASPAAEAGYFEV